VAAMARTLVAKGHRQSNCTRRLDSTLEVVRVLVGT